MQSTREAQIRQLYDQFNARNSAAIMHALHDHVDWPNGWEGGRVAGKSAVEDYWKRQWLAIDPAVKPTAFEELPDGRLRVTVHQLVKDKEGKVLDDRHVGHTYTFLDDKVSRMDIEED